MKRLAYIPILLSFFVCYSCNKKKQSATTYTKTTVLPVNLDTTDTEVSFYDIFDSVSLIPLETKEESFIYRIDKIIVHHDSIFIMDKRQGTIFLFDSNGRYLNKLSKQGEGPDEYTDLSDFTINPYSNELEILSAYNGVYCYDLNLHFKHKNTFNKPNLVHRFAIIDSVTKVFFNVVRKQNIEVYDIRNNKLINSYFEIPHNIRRNTPLGGPFILEHVKDGEVVFTQPFSNISYTISRSSFKPRYKWDFGKYNFDIYKLKNNLSQNEYYNIFSSNSFLNNNVYSFLANTDNNRFYLTQFSFGKNHDVYTVIHKKNSKEKIKFKELKEGLAFPYYPLLTDKYIYIIPRDTLVINRYLNEKIKKENGIVLDKWNEEQNPVILRYKLKNATSF